MKEETLVSKERLKEIKRAVKTNPLTNNLRIEVVKNKLNFQLEALVRTPVIDKTSIAEVNHC